MLASPRPLALLLAFPALALGLSACDSASPVAPAGTILTVSANPTKIPLTGESTITVRGFRPNGSPLNPGTQLTLSTDLGTLQPVTGSVPGGLSAMAVDEEGNASFRLLPDGRTGPATVKVKAPPAEGEGSAMVQIGEVATSKPTLLLSANPTSVAAGEESAISMLGRNPDNTPVPAGQRVRLTVDLGEIACAGSPGGGCREVFTDQNGEAEATFIAGDRGGTGRVAGILGTSDEASVQINIRTRVDSLSLSADRTSIQRVEAGTNVNLTAVLLDALGSPVQGASVLFDSPKGTLSDNRVPSNAQGEATTVLNVKADDVRDILEGGFFTVEATVTSEGQTESDTLRITVLGAP